MDTPRTTQILALMVLVFAGFSFWRFGFGHSPDLMATWLAGHFYGSGALDQVYPADTDVYTMLPPADWWPWLQEQGRDSSVFPFVYPPIWAVLASWMTPHVGIDAFQVAASVVNPLLLGSSVVLALKATGLRGQDWLISSTIGLIVMIITLAGSVALEQNQPQILVTFLLIVAFERDKAGAVRLAGAALALAAAIKLYPALIAILWLANRRYRSAMWFTIVGASVALVSVALAGWPLHAHFLHEIGVIKNTVLVTYFTYGFDPIIAQTLASDQLQFIAGLDNDPNAASLAGWTILQKGTLWANASLLALAVLTGVTCWRFWRVGDPNGLLFPTYLIALALISPLSWGYHYLPALCFAPILLIRYGPKIGGLILIALIWVLSISGLEVLARVPITDLFPQIAGTIAMAVLGLALLLAPKP